MHAKHSKNSVRRLSKKRFWEFGNRQHSVPWNSEGIEIQIDEESFDDEEEGGDEEFYEGDAQEEYEEGCREGDPKSIGWREIPIPVEKHSNWGTKALVGCKWEDH